MANKHRSLCIKESPPSMKAMILAAGRGERMRPLTDYTPKPLLEVGGKALIVWHIERLAQAGFTEIVINHAHLGDKIEHTLRDGVQWGVRIAYSREEEALETAGGIAKAMPLLQSDCEHPQTFLVINADVFCDVDFSAVAKTGLARCASGDMLAHLVMVPNPPQHPEGDFAIKQQGLIFDSVPKYTYSGIGIYHPALFAELLPGQAAKLAPLLMAAIRAGKVSGELYGGRWHDIGTPERLHALNVSLR